MSVGEHTPVADLRPLLPAIRDQGQRGTCVAFAVTAAHEVGRSGGHAVTELLSEDSLYWGCKKVDQNWHAGTRFSSAAAALANRGQVLATEWPYDRTIPDGRPYVSPQSAATATWHRSRLRPTASDLPSIRRTLDSGAPVVLGLAVYGSFYTPDAHGDIPVPGPNDRFSGRHAVLAVGHDGAATLIRSWGTWGLGGYAWLPPAYVHRHVTAAWVIGTGTAVATAPAAATAATEEIYGTQ